MNGARQDNGLSAAAFVPIGDVRDPAGESLLAALGRTRIAAYLEAVGDTDDAGEQWRRLWVAADEQADARSVVVSAARRLASDGDGRIVRRTADGVADGAVDDAFAALVGDWHVDTIAALRQAERDLNREDAEWRARLAPPPEQAEDPEEHYVPPPPPPLPRLAPVTVGALLIMLAALTVFIFGDRFDLGGDLGFFVGVAGVLTSVGMLVMRMRALPRDDEDDDGAVL